MSSMDGSPRIGCVLLRARHTCRNSSVRIGRLRLAQAQPPGASQRLIAAPGSIADPADAIHRLAAAVCTGVQN